MENANTARFEIPTENVPALRAKLEKLSRKAAKIGTPISWTFGDAYIVRRRLEIQGRDTGRAALFSFTPVDVSTARPCFEGWTFLGSMDHTSAAPAVIRRMVPGVECPAYAIAAAPGTCDHCHKARQRSETFVVQHTDGSVKVVGRQCVADFLGHASAAALAQGLSYLLEACDAAEDSERGGGSGRWDESTLDVLIQAFAVVRVEGSFRPSSFDEKSTRSIVSSALMGPTPYMDADEKAYLRSLAPTLADAEQAWAALAWLSTQRVDSDYMSNLVAIASSENCPTKNFGILVSLTGAYARAMGEIVRRAAAPVSAHVGVVGERQDLGTATVERVHAFDSMYGTCHFVTLRTDAGAVLSWKASNLPEGVAVGTCWTVTATVKAHSDYRGTAQTEIARAKLARA